MPTVIVFVFLTAVLPLFVCFLCQQVLRGGQVFPKKQHDFVSNGLWGGPAEWELRDTGSIVGTSWQQKKKIGSTLYTQDGCSAALGKRQASVCLPAILFKTPLSVPKDSIVNVQLFAPPTPQHWAVTNFDVQLCLLSWALYCLYVLWNLFPVCFVFSFRNGSLEGMYSLFSLYI